MVYAVNIPIALINIIIFITGLYAGSRTYRFLKEYLDTSFKIQRTDDKVKTEELGVKLAETLQQLAPWAMVYVLCVVLFIIILYAVLN